LAVIIEFMRIEIYTHRFHNRIGVDQLAPYLTHAE
jgi:hypothetical protein